MRNTVDTYLLNQHRLHNLLQTLLLLGGMGLLLGVLGWVIAGGTGIAWTIFLGVVALLFTPRISPRMILHLYGAREVDPYVGRALYELLGELGDALIGLP